MRHLLMLVLLHVLYISSVIGGPDWQWNVTPTPPARAPTAGHGPPTTAGIETRDLIQIGGIVENSLDSIALYGRTVFLPLKVPQDGVLVGFRVNFRSADPLTLSVWEYEHGAEYLVLYIQEVTGGVVNTTQFIPVSMNEQRCPRVRRGSWIGVYTTGNALPIHTYNERLQTTHIMSRHNVEMPPIGEDMDFFETPYYRSISLQAIILPDGTGSRPTDCHAMIIDLMSTNTRTTMTTPSTTTTTLATTTTTPNAIEVIEKSNKDEMTTKTTHRSPPTPQDWPYMNNQGNTNQGASTGTTFEVWHVIVSGLAGVVLGAVIVLVSIAIYRRKPAQKIIKIGAPHDTGYYDYIASQGRGYLQPTALPGSSRHTDNAAFGIRPDSSNGYESPLSARGGSAYYLPVFPPRLPSTIPAMYEDTRLATNRASSQKQKFGRTVKMSDMGFEPVCVRGEQQPEDTEIQTDGLNRQDLSPQDSGACDMFDHPYLEMIEDDASSAPNTSANSSVRGNEIRTK